MFTTLQGTVRRTSEQHNACMVNTQSVRVQLQHELIDLQSSVYSEVNAENMNGLA